MADYKAMYLKLLDTSQKIIEQLQQAMLETEEIYIQTDGIIDDDTENGPEAHQHTRARSTNHRLPLN